MEIAIPLYDRFTALDAVGPYQVLSALPEARVRFIAAEAGPVRADNRMLTLVAEASLDDVPSPDILVVPGGIGTRAAAGGRAAGRLGPHRTRDLARTRPRSAPARCCSPPPGILDGVDATTHWMVRDFLGELGANPVTDRVVERGKVFTAAGVSSGIDMALVLAERIAGPEVSQAIQLAIEYDPEPPHDSGSPEKAPKEIVELVGAVMEQMESEAASA